MSPNADTIVQELHAEFESMLSYVKASHTVTADEMERGLFRRLLSLGARLMLLFFALRTGQALRSEHQMASGVRVPYVGERRRQYFSIFGKLAFWRPYFYRGGSGGATPLDQELALGDDCYSDLVRELAGYFGVGSTYAKVAECFAHILGLHLSTQALSDVVTEDAVDVEAFYAQQAPPPPASTASMLVIQADGKGVPMVRVTPATPKVRLGKGDKHSRKKEAIVTGIYTLVPQVRTPTTVVANLFHPKAASDTTAPRTQAPSGPQAKRLWATLDGKDAALERLVQQAAKYEGPHIQHRVALTDGAEALQNRVQAHFPTFTLVLDFIHANEKLWSAANALFGETAPQRTPWVETQTLAMLEGRTAQVISTLRQFATAPAVTTGQQAALTKAANYFERNAAYMHYDQYLANGWPIASGVIEGACRHLVKDRCELSGMRWTQAGAENLLRLRAVVENGDWSAYQRFHQEQRHQRLYRVPRPVHALPESQSLADADLLTKPLPVQRPFIMPIIVPPRSAHQRKRAA